MIKNRRAFIVGLKSSKLSNKEITFLKKYKPWGIILFSRNISSIEQAKKLTDRIKKIFKDNKNIKHITLYTTDSAIGFWKKLGGEILGEFDGKYYMRIDRI